MWNSTALSTTVDSSSALHATVPAGLIATPGQVNLKIVNPDGSASLSWVFVVSAIPTISSFSPASVSAGGPAFTLTVNGAYYVSGTVVQWNGANLTTTFVSATQVTALVPAAMIAAAEQAWVSVVNPGGYASENLFNVTASIAPGLTSLSPNTVAAGGPAFTLTVYGTNFVTGTVVQWNGSALATTFVGAGQVTASVPANLIASPGTANISVINPGSPASGPAALIIALNNPVITSLDSQVVTAGGPSFTLGVTGTGFTAGATVQWNGAPLPTTLVNDKRLVATVAASLIASPATVVITVVSGGLTSNAFNLSVNASVPLTVTLIGPSPISAGSGQITIGVQGTGFVQGSIVNWAGTPLATFYQSPTQLGATLPASASALSGKFQVTVKNPDGTVSPPFAIKVDPVLTALIPTGAPVGSSDLVVTVTGLGFTSADILDVVENYTHYQVTTTPVNSTTLNAVIPATLLQSVVPVSIDVLDTSDGDMSPPQNFQIVSPNIASLTPATITAGGPLFTLTVTGAGFVPSAVVKWNGLPLPTTFAGASQLNCTVPAPLIASPGPATITVLSGGVTSNSSTLAILPGSAPSLTGASPNPVDAGGPQFTLTVNGTGFVPGSTAIWAGAPLTTAYQSASQLAATVPAGLIALSGRFAVTVANPSGLPSNSYSVIVNPVLTSINPASVPIGSPANLTLTGAGFTAVATVVVSVSSSQWTLSPISGTATSLTVTVPSAALTAAGRAMVSVVNSDGNGISRQVALTITTPVAAGGPSISTIAPSSTVAGSQALTLTVNGANFVAGSIVQWPSSPLATTFVSATQLAAALPSALLGKAGSYPIQVLNPDGSLSNAVNFTVTSPPPSIAGITPASVTAGSAAFTLLVQGSAFVPGCTVLWNGTPLATTLLGATQLSAAVSAGLIASAGTAGITVVAPDGTTSNSVNLAITPPYPTLTAINPSSVAAGGAAFTLNLTGTNFVAGSVATLDAGALATTLLSATQLSASVPASLIASPRNALVAVQNPGGATTGALPLAITAAASLLTGMNPSTAVAGGAAFTLTVTGTGLQAGASILWNGAPLPTTAGANASQLLATVPAVLIATPGSVSVSVQMNGKTSNSLTFTINAPIPTLASLNPSAATAGGASFTLTANGSNFVPGALIQWNGAPLGTAFYNSTQLTAQVAASLIAQAGAASVTVTNPGQPSSAPLAFLISPAAPSVTLLTPAAAMAGGSAFTLTVTGANFLPGATVQWNGAPVSTSYTSASQLAASIPASLIAAAGSVNVAVVNPPNALSNTVAFPISPPGPALFSLSPAAATAGGSAFQLAANGANFPAGAAILWNGGPLSTTWVSAAQLTATVPASAIAAPGSATVAVIVGSSTLTNSVLFSINPVLPATSQAAIVNAASSVPAIAPGSLISIYGTDLAASTLQAASTPLPNSLGGTSVAINGIPMPLLFVSAHQINGQVPFEIPPGNASMVIQVNGVKSAPVSFAVEATAPGILTLLQDNYALALNDPDGTLNSAQQPAVPGQYVTIYLTGQGQLDNPVATGAAAPSTPFSVPLAPVTAAIGGQPAYVQFAGLAPGFVGLLQMNLKVPAVSAGEQILEVSIGGVAAVPSVISVGTAPAAN
jgi:uncharacterized protein (TIGR03437 family)